MAKLGIIGMGNMGEAILKMLLAAGHKKKDFLCAELKEERSRSIHERYGIEPVSDVAEVVRKSRYVILAVKPQDVKELAPKLAPYLDGTRIVISILAGTTTSSLMSAVDKPVKLVRVMPNICVKVGEGVLGICANYLVERREVQEIVQLLAPLGLVVEIGEDLMDAVTALSGSGPALFLAFLEGMIDAGVKMGLPRDKATALSVQTVKGTVTMLQEEKLHPTLMKEMVTSPGGTTIAGLFRLEEKGFKGTLMSAFEKARDRARELAK